METTVVKKTRVNRKKVMEETKVSLQGTSSSHSEP